MLLYRRQHARGQVLQRCHPSALGFLLLLFVNWYYIF